MPAPRGIRGAGGPPFSPARTASTGAGTSFSTSASEIGGVFQIAFDDAWNEPNPTWTRIDDPGGQVAVQRFQIDRGRDSELDRTQAGSASVFLKDLSGWLDPTNTAGPWYGKLNPMKQAAIAVQNPVTGDWETLFRGHISSIRPTIDVSETFEDYVIEIDGPFAVLAACELLPGVHGDSDVPTESEGDIYYDSVPVDSRINHVLNDAGWAWEMREVFSGNVLLKATVVAPRNSALAVMQDAADAEFPGVANVFETKDGKVAFHGRLARFNPDGYTEFISQWRIADIPNAGG